jgi:hypothetical protein
VNISPSLKQDFATYGIGYVLAVLLTGASFAGGYFRLLPSFICAASFTLSRRRGPIAAAAIFLRYHYADRGQYAGHFLRGTHTDDVVPFPRSSRPPKQET